MREGLDPSLPTFTLLLPTPSISLFGMGLMEKSRGFSTAHAALCIFSLAFVFPRYTHIYPQSFLQLEMLVWHHTWKVLDI